MTYGDFKDFPRKKAVDKVLRDKAFGITKNLKYDGYQRGIASMIYTFFDKKPFVSGVKSEIISNQRPSDLATRELAK